jgi:hypothetical protein
MFIREKEKEKKKKGNTDNKIGTDIQANKHRNTHYHIFTCTVMVADTCFKCCKKEL